MNVSFELPNDYLTDNNIRGKKGNNYSASSFINDSVNNIIIENNSEYKYQKGVALAKEVGLKPLSNHKIVLILPSI